MARNIRIHFTGAYYHVILRGNNRDPIFFSENDHYKLCFLLQEGLERFGHKIHAFCFMPNHIHLVVEVNDHSVSKIVQNFAFRYTGYVNHRYGRVGHLFQGRFKSILVDDCEDETYLSELVRYIHLNPVRARVVFRPEDYFWSSHRAYLGLCDIGWLTQKRILKRFDDYEDSARKYLKDYVDQGIDKDLELKVHVKKGRFLGSDEFFCKICTTLDEKMRTLDLLNLNDIVKIVCQEYGVSTKCFYLLGKQKLNVEIRGVVAYFVKKSPSVSLSEMSMNCGLDSSSLSKRAIDIEKKRLNDSDLSERLERIEVCLREKTKEKFEIQ